jgi:hypothetical protein
MNKYFEYYFYDLFSNESTLSEVIKIIWEPFGFDTIKKVYREIEWGISLKELNKLKKDYKKILDGIYKKFPHFKDIDYGIPKENKEALLVRYYLIGALNNASLSVPQRTKLNLRKLGLKHEIFGSFFNTHKLLNYCCLFPDLESPRCKSDFYSFLPSDSKEVNGYLVNPPYDKSHIKASIDKVLEWTSSKINLRFFVILPVWDNNSRLLYNLPLYSDFPEITNLIDSKNTVFHRIFEGPEFPFYDGTKNKLVNLKEPIHVFVIQSPNLFWNENMETLFLHLIRI